LHCFHDIATCLAYLWAVCDLLLPVITSYVADMCYISKSFDLERFKIVHRHSGSLAVILNVAKQILPFNWQSLSDRPDVTFY